MTTVLSGDVSATGIQVHVNILSEWQTQMWDVGGRGEEEETKKRERVRETMLTPDYCSISVLQTNNFFEFITA